MDAVANRLREGLRTIEDQLRFSNASPAVFAKLKNFRHDLQDILPPADDLLANRHVEADAGTEISTEHELCRMSVQQILYANFKRVQESLRSLEEQMKLIDSKKSKQLEALRYQSYVMEQDICLPVQFPQPCLYVILTQSLCTLSPRDVLKQICDAGVDIIQIREKNMEDGEFLEWTQQVLEISEGSPTKIVINDRIHIAMLCDVHGVHLGQGDLPTVAARKLLGKSKWIGRSTHDLHEALRAQGEGIDYIGVGPIYPTKTKEHRQAVGLAYLQQVQEQIELPYVAIGSVNRTTLSSITTHKPNGIAICTGIISDSQPYHEAVFYKSWLAEMHSQNAI